MKGKRIRTTLPNIEGTVTATVGEYNDNEGRVQLIYILSDRLGTKYGNLKYLPIEIAGLEEIGSTTGSGDTTTQDDTAPADCSFNYSGKFIKEGRYSFGFEDIYIKYEIYECQIVVTSYFGPIEGRRDVIKRSQNGLEYKVTVPGI